MKAKDHDEQRASVPANSELELEPEIRQALNDFKSSVHAWSDQQYTRARAVAVPTRRSLWRPAAGWSIAAVLLAASMGGGTYYEHQQQVTRQLAAQHAAELERQAAQKRAQEVARRDEEMLASVDSDVSREVPSAMEPFARLIDESASR